MPEHVIRNPVLEKILDRLSRYGYRRQTGDTIPPAAEWARLKGDFAELGRATVPNFNDLAPSARAAAETYLAVKSEADRLLRTCEAAHADILSQGLDVARVEDYAVVRDAYEDKVEEFGAARAALSETFGKL